MKLFTVIYCGELFGIFSSAEKAKAAIRFYISQLPEGAVFEYEFDFFSGNLDEITLPHIKDVLFKWVPIQEYIPTEERHEPSGK